MEYPEPYDDHFRSSEVQRRETASQEMWAGCIVSINEEHAQNIIPTLQAFVHQAPTNARRYTRNLCLFAQKGTMDYRVLTRISQLLQEFERLGSVHLFFNREPTVRTRSEGRTALLGSTRSLSLCRVSVAKERECVFNAWAEVGTGLVELYVDIVRNGPMSRPLYKLENNEHKCGDLACAAVEGIKAQLKLTF